MALEVKESERERLAATGLKLAGVVHDIRGLMNVISGYTELMAANDDRSERDAYAEKISDQLHRVAAMASDVLAYARGERTLLVRKVYLDRFLGSVTEQLQFALRDTGVELHVDAEYTGVAFFDEHKIQRLINNLARNSVQAIGTGGGRLSITTYCEDRFLCLEFADTGRGIPVAIKESLFDSFVTATEGGTGIGLSIVKSIVEEHQGLINYRSTPGLGTTFVVRLPLAPPQLARGTQRIDQVE